MIQMWVIKPFKLPGSVYNYALLLFALISGLLVYKDYGMCWDELTQYNNGKVVYNFVIKGNQNDYLASAEKYHGGIFEFLLYTIRKIFSLTDSRTNFLMRHLVSFLFYWFAAIFFMRALNRIYKHWFVTFCGIAMYFLAPRIFPDAFYNSKDIPVLGLVAISFYSFQRFIQNRTLWDLVFHSIICALLVSMQLSMAIIPLISLTLIIYSKRGEWELIFRETIIFLVITVIFIIAFWPILWLGPIHHFKAAVYMMNHFTWDSYVLFKNQIISARELPWDYIPYWFTATTPPAYLILFILSLLLIVISWFKNTNKITINYYTIYALGVFFGPLICVILLKTVLYDGWRHLYYIYIPFIFISCYGVNFLIRKALIIRSGVILFMCLVFVSVFSLMKNLHPYEHIYFNRLFFTEPSKARFQMEMDYWGLTYQEAFKYILSNDGRDSIRVLVDNNPGLINLELLKKEQRQRLIVDTNRSNDYDYFVGNYRWMQYEYNYASEVYSIVRANTKICTVIRFN